MGQPVTESLSECPLSKGPVGPVAHVSLMVRGGRGQMVSVGNRVVLSIILSGSCCIEATVFALLVSLFSYEVRGCEDR